MKKLVMFLGVLALMVVLSASQTGAALLGMYSYRTNFPRVSFDGSGTITYTAGTDLFTLVALDNKFIWGPGVEDFVLPNVGLGLAIYVDENGNLTGGVSDYTYSWTVSGTTYSYPTSGTTDYDMVEVALQDVTIRGKTYTAGTLLLGAEVIAFGWDEVNRNQFDFLFGDMYGALVDDGLWPSTKSGAHLPGPYTGMLAETEYWPSDWTWQKDLTVSTVEGKKMPTPEPSSLLLLGSGLLGFGAFFRARFGRKKKD